MIACGLVACGELTIPTLAAAAEDQPVEEIVVTGSRLRRDSYTSPTPLQVLDVEEASRSGITTISELLQRSTVANGQQIDTTFNGNAGASNASEPPPVGGVGSANISLRGLGPERTLVLLNGKRLGSSGVRGAPAQPDINLLPMNMVRSVEVITEGASAVYGADAVAGVVNLLLKDDFEGFEVTMNLERPDSPGGDIDRLSFLTGTGGDRGHFVLGGDWYDQERISAGQRADCLRTRAITQDGTQFDICRDGFFDNVALDLAGQNPQDIFSFYTPGSTNIGVPDWSSAAALPTPAPPGAAESPNQRDKFTYIDFYGDQDERRNADLVAPIRRYSVVALGSFQPGWFEGDQEIYFESYYFNRRLKNIASIEQIFPTVPGMIPQEDANGNIVVDGTGAPVLVDNPLNPFPVNASPIVTLEDVPQTRDVELGHYRGVVGFRGDFPGGWLADRNWSFDMYGSYDRGVGDQSQQVLNETSLLLSLETLRLDSGGNPICGVPAQNNDIGFLSPRDCVPVNLFAPSIFTGGRMGEGVFSSDAEREFLLATRTNHTVVTQTMFAGYATGELFEIPGGGLVQVAIGGEYRLDEIKSTAEVLGATGSVAAENPLTEGATNGDRDIIDWYAEFTAPLIAGRDWVDLLQVEGAVRYTDEENFGSKTTWRARASYRPVDWASLSASWGTSFRAPNLREQFLADQFSSIAGDADPCEVPDDANVNGMYDAARDVRPQVVIDNCIASGADPTALGLSGSTSIPVAIGGNAQDLDAETSDSFTATVQFSPPIGDVWDLGVAVSYFDIDIKDTVRSINGSTILQRCYNEAPNLSSPFCSRVERGTAGFPSFNFPTLVDASFINVGKETSKGVDVNVRIATSFEDVFGQPLRVDWSNGFTRQLERDLQIFEGDLVDDQVGDFGVPKNQYSSVVTLGWGDFEFLWEARYFSGTHAGLDASISANCGVYELDEGFVGSPQVRPDCSAGSATYHDISLTYFFDETLYVTVGSNNITDKDPALVSGSAGSNRLNRVTSSHYDQFGRTYFLVLKKSL